MDNFFNLIDTIGSNVVSGGERKRKGIGCETELIKKLLFPPMSDVLKIPEYLKIADGDTVNEILRDMYIFITHDMYSELVGSLIRLNLSKKTKRIRVNLDKKTNNISNHLVSDYDIKYRVRYKPVTIVIPHQSSNHANSLIINHDTKKVFLYEPGPEDESIHNMFVNKLASENNGYTMELQEEHGSEIQDGTTITDPFCKFYSIREMLCRLCLDNSYVDAYSDNYGVTYNPHVDKDIARISIVNCFRLLINRKVIQKRINDINNYGYIFDFSYRTDTMNIFLEPFRRDCEKLYDE